MKAKKDRLQIVTLNLEGDVRLALTEIARYAGVPLQTVVAVVLASGVYRMKRNGMAKRKTRKRK